MANRTAKTIIFDLKNLVDCPGGVQSDIRILIATLKEHSDIEVEGIIFPRAEKGIDFNDTDKFFAQSLRLHIAKSGYISFLRRSLMKIGSKFTSFAKLESLLLDIFDLIKMKSRRKYMKIIPVDKKLNFGIYEWLFCSDLGEKGFRFIEVLQFYISDWSWKSLSNFAHKYSENYNDVVKINLPDNQILWLGSPLALQPDDSAPYFVRWHDAINLSSIGWESYSGAKAFSSAMKKCIEGNSVFLCSSETSKKQLLDIYPTVGDKAKVVYCPVTQSKDDLVAAQFHKDYLSNFKLEKGKYLVTVSSINPRKNMNVLLDIFLNLRTHYPKIKLVMIGESFKKVLQTSKKIEPLKKDGVLFMIDNVPRSILNVIISNSILYLSAPIHEDSGRVLIEAQLCRVPVVAPDIEIFNEILGESALLYNNDLDASDQCQSLMSNPDFRNEVIEKGYTNSLRFSPKKTVQNIKQILKKLN